MSKRHLGLVVGMAACVAASAASAQELRVGFINSRTGWSAAVGDFLDKGWALGLERQGWAKNGDKLAGVPTHVFMGDDQSGKVDAGLSAVDKFIKQHKVHIVTGFLWSNVMLAARVPVFESKALLLTAMAGATPMAGEQCNPLFVSLGWVSDGAAEAAGELATKDGIQTVVAMAPNYQAGKDHVTGFARGYKGKIVDQILFKLGEGDFQAEISKIRALAPQAVYIFAPGAMGIAFTKQWATSGLTKNVKLLSQNTIDSLTLGAIGEAGIGATEVQHWNPDLDIPKNKEFIKDYVAKYGQQPTYLAMQAYDAVNVIAAGLRATGGKTDDMLAFSRAIRQGTMDSPRGAIKFNVNGFPIQPYWRLQIVAGSDGKPMIKGGEKVSERKDSHWEKCPPDKRT
jgi:branched-chain amino acid transport system substrate-binding protein